MFVVTTVYKGRNLWELTHFKNRFIQTKTLLEFFLSIADQKIEHKRDW
ncbi:hypothetical protein LEP1GSC046_0533 [Leptospira kirschneri serovar Bim str. 1051]|nr:hypothetical protein LEP1GSC042_0639 [Leptospira kirschneri serovar Bim str. PUO 1247]EMN03911.1 hypothetical protein LEP1GSC046_0533 [Leptospira kirschneri serovar Bim str. 1051]